MNLLRVDNNILIVIKQLKIFDVTGIVISDIFSLNFKDVKKLTNNIFTQYLFTKRDTFCNLHYKITKFTMSMEIE